MLDDPYSAPKSGDHSDSNTSSQLLKFAAYLFVPSLMISVPVLAKIIPLWHAPLFVAAGFLMIWAGEVFGTCLFAPNLPRHKKAIRRSLYCVPVTIWAVTKMYGAYGIVASVVIALAVVPGLITMLVWDKPPRDKVS